MAPAKKLSPAFYQRKTKTVALELLGKKLVHVYKGKRLGGIITEVEAYLGEKDRACHTYEGRRTPRVEPMYLEGGHVYVYLIYGMHYCFNVVTEKHGVPEAVLVRALKPVEGLEYMGRPDLNGPGKLCRGLHIDKSHSGLSLQSRELFIEDAPKIKPSQIIKSPRIGVDYAGSHAEWPLRYRVPS